MLFGPAKRLMPLASLAAFLWAGIELLGWCFAWIGAPYRVLDGVDQPSVAVLGKHPRHHLS